MRPNTIANRRSRLPHASIRRYLLLVCLLLSGCAGPATDNLPRPTDWLPTSVAATLSALQTSPAGPAQPATPATVPPTGAPAEAGTPTDAPLNNSFPELPPAATLTATPASGAPNAPIQIYRPGDQSKVVSPLHVVAFLKPGEAGKVRVELFGEDGRLLVRQLLTFTSEPNAYANLTVDLDFEIAAAAEIGRLVISVEDKAGRLLSLNSVDLILLSVGEEDINPATALYEAIVIQQPGVKSLVQGSSLLVTGSALLRDQDALVVQLVNAKKGVVGMRLASVTVPGAEGYGTFSVEVPFKVNAATPVRLIVYERGGAISEMIYLTSREILLGP